MKRVLIIGGTRGMGLGLAITYGIVKDYGGDIVVDETPGGGCTFRLTFPVARNPGVFGA